MYSTPLNLPNDSEAVSTKVAAETGIEVESARVIIVIEVSSGVHINVFKMVFILVVSDFFLIVWVDCFVLSFVFFS